MDAITHRDLVLADLKEGLRITAYHEFLRHGCMRLAARIYELKGMGYNIAMEYAVKNGKRFAEYHLVRGRK